MNKQLYTQTGVTEKEYKAWCKEHNKPSYKPEVRQEFFARVIDNRIVKDKSGKLVKKNRKKVKAKRYAYRGK